MSTPADLSQTLGSISSTLLTDDANLQASLRRVAIAGCSLLTNCKAASATIVEGRRPATMAATDDSARRLDEAQYRVDEGPCLAAARERRTIRIDVVEDDGRWPLFMQAARQEGVGSTLSVPMDLGGTDEYVGGLNIYAETQNGFSEQDEQLAVAFATQASIVVANARAYWSSFELTRHLTTAMNSRAIIEQAKGILMAKQGITADEAFDHLRHRSQSENRKLRDLASEIVTQVQPPRDVPSDER